MVAAQAIDQTAVEALASFPLLDALFGRRARRFGLGMTIPDGPLAYTSAHSPLTLSEAERTLLILCGVGVSGWNFGIPHTTSGTPDSGCNYPSRFVGRTYPSGAAVHSSELLITDDSGSYITQFRNLDPSGLREYGDVADLDRLLEVARRNIVRLAPGRVELPREAATIFARRKFGPGGTFDPARPGPFSESAAIKARVDRYTPELVEYLGSVAQDIQETYGKFPATVPSIFAGVYTQAHHLDLDFYDRFFGPDAYLATHAQHQARWHSHEAASPGHD